MSFFDIVLDFILMDAFEDLESPPSSVVAVLRNRWLSDSFKETVNRHTHVYTHTTIPLELTHAHQSQLKHLETPQKFWQRHESLKKSGIVMRCSVSGPGDCMLVRSQSKETSADGESKTTKINLRKKKKTCTDCTSSGTTWQKYKHCCPSCACDTASCPPGFSFRRFPTGSSLTSMPYRNT